MGKFLLSLLAMLVGITSGAAETEPKRDVNGLAPGMSVGDVIARLKQIGVGANLYFATEESDGWDAFGKIHKVDSEQIEEFRRIGCISGRGDKGEDFTEVTCYKERDFYRLDFTRHLTSTHLKKIVYNFPSNLKSGEMMKNLRRQYRLGKAKPDDYNRFDLGNGYKLTMRQRSVTSRSELTIISTHLWTVDAEAGSLARDRSNPEPGL
jgi:hypothetical protein